jgi:hypothetical protein
MSRRQTSASDDFVALTGEDMARFHRNAPAALARRGGGHALEALAGSLELIAMGAVPIAGMMWFGWSAVQLLVFLVISMWVGIACDFARLALAGRGVRQFAQAHFDDWHVWVVVTSLRSGKHEAPRSHVQAKYQPGDGVFVDLAAGGFSTALMAGAIGYSHHKFGGEAIFDQSFVFSLGCMAAYQGLAATWEIVRHRRGGPDVGPVAATPGVRGAGLFLLMFVSMTYGDPDGPGGLAVQRVMLAVNAVIVAVGVLNALAVVWLQRETKWLRDYLRQRPPEPEAPPHDKKRKLANKRANERN